MSKILVLYLKFLKSANLIMSPVAVAVQIWVPECKTGCSSGYIGGRRCLATAHPNLT